MLRAAFNNIVHLFFPHICAGCGTDLISERQLLCFTCSDQLPQTNFHYHQNNPVEKIFWGRLPLNSAASYFFFTKNSVLQHLLHQLKYENRPELGLYLGRIMGEGFLNSHRFKHFDLIIPLPLHREKQKKRGYNQAEEIAKGIGEVLQLPVRNDLVHRIKKTDTQTFRNRVERWENIKSKFLLSNQMALQNKHVLLVDDVVTTGATLESCGTEILNADGCHLSIATVAYTSL